MANVCPMYPSRPPMTTILRQSRLAPGSVSRMSICTMQTPSVQSRRTFQVHNPFTSNISPPRQPWTLFLHLCMNPVMAPSFHSLAPTHSATSRISRIQFPTGGTCSSRNLSRAAQPSVADIPADHAIAASTQEVEDWLRSEESGHRSFQGDARGRRRCSKHTVSNSGFWLTVDARKRRRSVGQATGYFIISYSLLTSISSPVWFVLDYLYIDQWNDMLHTHIQENYFVDIAVRGRRRSSKYTVADGWLLANSWLCLPSPLDLYRWLALHLHTKTILLACLQTAGCACPPFCRSLARCTHKHQL